MWAGEWLGYLAPFYDEQLDTPTLPQFLSWPIVNVWHSVSVTSRTHAQIVLNWLALGMWSLGKRKCHLWFCYLVPVSQAC